MFVTRHEASFPRGDLYGGKEQNIVKVQPKALEVLKRGLVATLGVSINLEIVHIEIENRKSGLMKDRQFEEKLPYIVLQKSFYMKWHFDQFEK